MSFEEAKKLDDHFVMHTFARKPVLLVEGSGMEVKDDEGKTYLDFIAGIGVDSLGHCHPAVVRAIQDQAAKLIHVSNYYYIEQRGEVAKLLSDMLEEAQQKGDSTIEELTDSNEVFADPADRATAESDRAFTLRIRDRERRLIRKIQAALQKASLYLKSNVSPGAVCGYLEWELQIAKK